MMRKLFAGTLVLAGIVGLASGVLGHEKVRLYGKTGERWLGEQVERVEGPPVKLELLKTKLQDLDREVSRLERGLIQRKVEVETLAQRIREEEAALGHSKRNLEREGQLLEEGRSRYEIAGRTYSRDVIERDARARLDACRDAERSIEDSKRVLAIRERTLELSRQSLEKTRTRRVEIFRELRTIDARIAEMKAKRRLAEALEAPSVSREVEGELAKVERMAKELRDRLQVEERLVDERLAKTNQGNPGVIDFDAKEPEASDTARDIKAFLTGKAAKEAAKPETAKTEAPALPAPPKTAEAAELH